jgi:hypothetical protein
MVDWSKVVGFDGSTTIAEFLTDLVHEIGCRAVELSGFTIHSDDPIDKDLDHALHLEDKVSCGEQRAVFKRGFVPA